MGLMGAAAIYPQPGSSLFLSCLPGGGDLGVLCFWYSAVVECQTEPGCGMLSVDRAESFVLCKNPKHFGLPIGMFANVSHIPMSLYSSRGLPNGRSAACRDVSPFTRPAPSISRKEATIRSSYPAAQRLIGMGKCLASGQVSRSGRGWRLMSIHRLSVVHSRGPTRQ